MNLNALWITTPRDYGDVCPMFFKDFKVTKKISKAILKTTAVGVYNAYINGKRVSEYVLAPGFTSGWYRIQLQEYDVTDMLEKENCLEINVAKGWWRSRYSYVPEICKRPAGLVAELEIIFDDSTSQIIISDESWKVRESKIRFSDIFDGEIYDATFVASKPENAVVYDGPGISVIPQEGEEIREKERISAIKIIKTPKGETVVDFGQNLTGYVEVTAESSDQEIIKFTHGEVLDSDGNFYNDNYRSAKPEYTCICKKGEYSYKPFATFYGFRYIKLESFPGGIDSAKAENFTAIAVYSNMKRTGNISCSDPLLNRFFKNVLWGQKGNFLDIPTDCPQRDERRGWTADAQVFSKAASYNFDTEKFFKKWLRDMHLEQLECGYVPGIVPTCDRRIEYTPSAGWADACTIIPWTLYMFYGNESILSEHFDMMAKWVDYIGTITDEQYLWRDDKKHYGDWLALDAPEGSYKGLSRDDFIATAFYAHSTELVIKAGKVIGKDVSKYETLYSNIVRKFRETFTDYRTQTECVLAAHFGLAPDPQAAVDLLATKIKECGNHFTTGFLGTAYLLHVLSDYGYTDMAYMLLTRREYPSWLYSVTKGATTVWEHWDGIKTDGSFWSADMNSFNHYAYGAVVDWIYGVAAGIKPVCEFAGFKKVKICPEPNSCLEWLEASFETRYGTVRSGWYKQDSLWRIEIETPVEAQIKIGKDEKEVSAGKYTFFTQI